MTHLRSFGSFWWGFIVGDDWRVAVGVVIALGLCALLVRHGVEAWWVLPTAVVLLLYGSLRRATRPDE